MAWRALQDPAGVGAFLAGARSNYLHSLGWALIVAAVEFAGVVATTVVTGS